MRTLLLIAALLMPFSAQAEEFDRSLLSGLWAENANTRLACAPEELHVRYELSADGKGLIIKFDRKEKINSGKTVEQFSATVLRSDAHTLVIRYNADAGDFGPNYPKEWEMVFVAPGVYRWRATDWPEGRVNAVVGIRCSQ